MAKKTVLITGTSLVPVETAEYITKRGFKVKSVAQDLFTDEELHGALNEVNGYLIGGYEQPKAEHFESAGELEAVGWIGTDYRGHVPGWRRAVELGIAFLNSPGTNAVSVAEFALLLTLTMSRPFTRRVVLPGERASAMSAPGFDLFRRRMGVIGLGRIGSRVARIAGLGFGMEVVYWGPRRNESLEQALDVSYLNRDALISSSDIISIHRPSLLTGENFEFGSHEFSLMKPGAIVINTVHNELIDPNALAWAIENRGVRVAQDGMGSGPDWERLVAYGPEKFLAVPSMGFNTVDANSRASLITAQGVCDVLTGEKRRRKDHDRDKRLEDLIRNRPAK
jgi:phosphoglycerate dehydrogenase-like enzyme